MKTINIVLFLLTRVFVEVTDMKKLSSYYLRYREPEVNKTLLKADLKAGVKLEGAVLTEKNNIQIK